MSREKFFARPKVRFSQTIDEQSIDGCKVSGDGRAISRVEGPRIRSIVALERPVKIMNLADAPGDSKNSDLNLNDKEQNKSLRDSDDVIPPNSSLKNDNAFKSDRQKPLRDSSIADNIKAKSESTHLSEPSGTSLDKGERKSVPNLVLPVQNERRQIRSKGGKENEDVVQKKCVKSVHPVKKTRESLKSSLSQANKGQTASGNSKKSQVVKTDVSRTRKLCTTTRTSTVQSTYSRRSLSSKAPVINVMPCLKYAKLGAKSKVSPVKKTIVRDIIGRKIKPYIGPGLPRKRLDSLVIPETKEDTHVRSDVCGHKLARPEYNSIMCTVNRLGEVRRQKIVTDVEHLPNAYKNLVNAKISHALDFPLDEAIYKNLVDLSVDEKQLPCRLTRSKDPEPRQRDIVPSLSDFFTPVCNEEYCTSIFVKPRNPEITDGWCAFKISDKITEWKDSMDRA